jgi:hypothetical protein
VDIAANKANVAKEANLIKEIVAANKAIDITEANEANEAYLVNKDASDEVVEVN